MTNVNIYCISMCNASCVLCTACLARSSHSLLSPYNITCLSTTTMLDDFVQHPNDAAPLKSQTVTDDNGWQIDPAVQVSV